MSYSCELTCPCWELNLGPPEEEPVLLTTKPAVQPLAWASGTLYTETSSQYCTTLVGYGPSEKRENKSDLLTCSITLTLCEKKKIKIQTPNNQHETHCEK